MAIKKERKRFQDYTLDERQDIWNTLHQALDEGGHDILSQDLLANLPDDEADYMKNEQFYGIAFDKTNFKDVYVINIINGNTLDAGESIDFDKIIEDGRKNQAQQKVLQQTPVDKSKTVKAMDIDDPDFDKTEEMLFDLESKLWHSPTGKVAWDDLKAYDDLHLKYSGRHFIPNYEMLDDMDARALVDDYLNYIAWENHGNESHWMEFPEYLFEPYLNPEGTLGYLEENGSMEAYDDSDEVRFIVDRLRALKKGKNMKDKTMKAQVLYGAFGGDEKQYYERILELAEENCPHATKIFAGFSTDVVWGLPSGNHPGLFINEHGNEGRTFYTCGMTAWKYLDFPENTPDGKMPSEFEVMAGEMYNKSNSGGLSESDLIGYMQRMDAMCAELQSIQKSKTKKGEEKIPVDEDDTVEIEEMDGERYVEIEPKEEHAEEVETGYEKESDDLNTEDNITHPDTSKPKETEKSKIDKRIKVESVLSSLDNMFGIRDVDDDMIQTIRDYINDYEDEGEDEDSIADMIYEDCFKSKKSKKTVILDGLTPAQAVQKCAQFQRENRRNGLMQDEVYELTGYNAESLFLPMMKRGQVTKHKCADGFIYNIRM